jgi:hypothetical protein
MNFSLPVVLGVNFKSLPMLRKHTTTEPHLQTLLRIKDELLQDWEYSSVVGHKALDSIPSKKQ